MQVNAVSAGNVQSFGNKNEVKDKKAMPEMLKIIAEADDRQLRQMAIKEASLAVNDKKHRKISNGIYWSLPVIAGIAAVARNPVKGLTAAGLSSRLVNLKNLAGTALSWFGTFAGLNMLFAAKNKLSEKSETVRNFDRKHSMLSTFGTVAAAIGAVILGGKGLSKLSTVLTNKITPAMSEKIAKGITKFDNKVLKNNVVLNAVSKGLSKIPSAIKNVAKGVLEWGPIAAIGVYFVHSIKHTATKGAVASQFYVDLKTAQATIKTLEAQEAAAKELEEKEEAAELNEE